MAAVGLGRPAHHTMADMSMQADRSIERYPNSLPAKFTEGDIIGELMHTVPLDGEWSDLTVTFALIRASDGISLCLNEIHVF